MRGSITSIAARLRPSHLAHTIANLRSGLGGIAPALDGRQEAHLIAFACSAAPEGHTHWTLQLLADKVVELEFAESISLETVRQILKKTNSSPGKRKSGCIPKVSGGVRGADGGRAGPVPTGVQSGASGSVFDETSRQLTGEVRPPIEAAPGRVARYDTEYQRNGLGTCS